MPRLLHGYRTTPMLIRRAGTARSIGAGGYRIRGRPEAMARRGAARRTQEELRTPIGTSNRSPARPPISEPTMAKRRTLCLLFFAILAFAPVINLALRGNPYRFAALLLTVFLLGVVAMAILPKLAPALISMSTVILSLAAIEIFFALQKPTSAHLEGGVTGRYITRDTPFGYAPNPGVFSAIKCLGDCAAHRIY